MRAPAWIAVASAAHAVVLASLLFVPIRRPLDSSRQPDAAIEIAITVEPTSPASVDRVDRDEPRGEETSGEATSAQGANAERATARGSAEQHATERTTPSPPTASSDPMSGPSGAPPSPSAEPAPSGGGVVPFPMTIAELGLPGPGGRNPFLPNKEEKVPAPNGADHPAARAMRGTGAAHDRQLGLGPEGPAIAALSDATTASIAPLRGRAHFIVRTGGDGLVSAIDLLDSEGGSGWIDAGRIALEKLRGKKFVIPRGGSAMNMHIEVRSEMKLPNGENGPIGGRLGENQMPELTIPDISNIGAKPRRIIHARAVGTDVF